MQIRNIIIIFTVSGFWHGAEWRFVIWGFLCGVVFIPLLLSGKHRMHLDTVGQDRILPSLKEIYQMVVTFVIFTLPLIIFRADNMSHAYHYLERMISTNPFVIPKTVFSSPMFLFLLSLMLIVEWFQRKKQHGLEINNIPLYIRWPVYYILTGIILYYSVLYKEETPFIYFQF